MTKLRLLALWALASGAPVLAQVTSINSSNPAPKGTGNPDRIVCEVEQTTGTRLGARKVCKTEAEWAQMRREHREGLEMFQRQGTSVGCQEGQACVPGG